MILVAVSLCINFLLVIFSFSHPDLPESWSFTLGMIMTIFWLTSLIGSLLYVSSKKKVFGILGLIGFLGFVPIGLIGAIGIRRAMDAQAQQKFIRNEE